MLHLALEPEFELLGISQEKLQALYIQNLYIDLYRSCV